VAASPAGARGARDGHRETFKATMSAVCKTLLMLAFAVGTEHGSCQSFYYVEPGAASCPAAPAPTTAAPKPVPRGVPVPGGISVACGFDKGSYTVTLNSTDPSATFSPKTFLVNFGRIVGNGVFAVTFSTLGVQSVSTTITSNMGSPAVRGHFASPANEFNVVIP
jgi:hypothetical protein